MELYVIFVCTCLCVNYRTYVSSYYLNIHEDDLFCYLTYQPFSTLAVMTKEGKSNLVLKAIQIKLKVCLGLLLFMLT